MSLYDFAKPRRAVRPSPLFLAFVAVTVVGGLLAWSQDAYGSRLGDLGVFLFVLGGWVVTLCLHEFAHAYAAYRAGDRSVEAAGYLTLNPFKYTHPLLSIILPLFFIIQGGIGLPGGAVYLHQHAFRSRASRSVAAAVGPLMNLIFGAGLLLAARSHNIGNGPLYLPLNFDGTPTDHLRFWSALAFLGFLQITATVLNLLPIPGLDGYAIIEPYLDPQTQHAAQKIKPWGMLGVIVLLQIQSLNDQFFRLIYNICDLFGDTATLSALGHEFFKFWVKAPF
ncbi:site-2 protease family protein [Jatrophihabitans sp.]|uniref:site-2 protease family protein n=1 Tax=Jatrophihabitans sp. TaxID=1932789 RepID=UPI0030C69015